MKGKPKKKAASPAKDQAWFERKATGLKAELDNLPADRQEQLRRELDESQDPPS